MEAKIYDVDLFDVSAEAVEQLHAQGRKVICYISAGSWEEWRPDADEFPTEIIGNAYDGWPGERWLDIRRLDLLGPLMAARLDLCRAKGFDAVEPDNIDGYQNDTGFALTAADQLTYNRWLAQEAHRRGLSIGLKNDPDQAQALVMDFDWALTEDCLADGWCDEMLVFPVANKPVFLVEYTDTGISIDELCDQTLRSGFNPILKERELTAWRERCP
jgi:endo-alpha-1,4-polygalactosaminidase (GH114 family)